MQKSRVGTITIRVKSRQPWGVPKEFYNRVFKVTTLDQAVVGARRESIYYLFDQEGYHLIKKEDCEVLKEKNLLGGKLNEK